MGGGVTNKGKEGVVSGKVRSLSYRGKSRGSYNAYDPHFLLGKLERAYFIHERLFC